jgi:hypothetical protein
LIETAYFLSGMFDHAFAERDLAVASHHYVAVTPDTKHGC